MLIPPDLSAFGGGVQAAHLNAEIRRNIRYFSSSSRTTYKTGKFRLR